MVYSSFIDMDDFKQFRYDFFGEYLTQESNSNAGVNGLHERNEGIDNDQCNEPLSCDMVKEVPEDSLIEFITDYFQGDVTTDFSETQPYRSDNRTLKGADESCNETPSKQRMNAFDCSSSSDLSTSTSIELFTSPDTSMNHANNSDQNMECNEGIENSDLLPATEDQARQSRRKSISYDIVFTNSKDQNGKVKIEIVPNKKPCLENVSNKSPTIAKYLPGQKKLKLNSEETLQQENILLRQRVHDLERKLRCIEMESERVVGELSRIIERKNETISQLELQIAGVKIM